MAAEPDEQDIPSVSLPLVEKLEELFPDRCPTDSMTDRDIWIAVGSANVVRYLRDQHEYQTTQQL